MTNWTRRRILACSGSFAQTRWSVDLDLIGILVDHYGAWRFNACKISGVQSAETPADHLINPTISKVGLLGSRVSWEKTSYGAAMREASKNAGIPLMWPIDGPLNETEYRRAFTAMSTESVTAVIVSEQNENWTYRRLIIELAERHRLPAIYPYDVFAELGGLMAYGLNIADLAPRVASVIDRILKGAHPGEIPIYQPTKFSLNINLKTAKSLGIEIPPSLLIAADNMIE